jgi:CcmD family protein
MRQYVLVFLRAFRFAFRSVFLPVFRSVFLPVSLRRLRAALPMLVLLASAVAQAEEFQPVQEGALRPRTDPNPFIIGAYGFIWAAVLVYVVMVARGLSRARTEIEELRGKVQGNRDERPR